MNLEQCAYEIWCQKSDLDDLIKFVYSVDVHDMATV